MKIVGLMDVLCVQVKAVQEYLKELLETTDQKLLVFAHHKDMLDGIEFIMNKSAPLHPFFLISCIFTCFGSVSFPAVCKSSLLLCCSEGLNW